MFSGSVFRVQECEAGSGRMGRIDFYATLMPPLNTEHFGLQYIIKLTNNCSTHPLKKFTIKELNHNKLKGSALSIAGRLADKPF